jgi:hypothetical protein
MDDRCQHNWPRSVCPHCGLLSKQPDQLGAPSYTPALGKIYEVTHELRSWSHLFEPICRGVKLHDLRKDDRRYRVGDILRLQEYDPGKGAYTGLHCDVEVTYITGRSEGQSPCAFSSVVLDPGYVILSIKKV